MSISGNEDGFKKFLEYVENSGDLNAETRLLDFTSINLSYSTDQEVSPTTGTDEITASVFSPVRTINASLNLRAFFQKPVEVTPTT